MTKINFEKLFKKKINKKNLKEKNSRDRKKFKETNKKIDEKTFTFKTKKAWIKNLLHPKQKKGSDKKNLHPKSEKFR